MTHTFVTLTVSADTYKEIYEKLRAAGYEHAFLTAGTAHPGKTLIDMHGIALLEGK